MPLPGENRMVKSPGSVFISVWEARLEVVE